MGRSLYYGLLVFSLLLAASARDDEYHHCNCDGDGLWSIESILQFQKVSDFLIATAYFSIPLELVYFATCTTLFPFKWIVLQFGAFIVLCGLTHLLTVFTYEPHSFLMLLALTVSKFLTALVSFVTALTLLTLIPQLLRVKVRENLLWLKASELDREVGMMKRQEEASWLVQSLTREIRNSLDRHTILYTTLIKLSKMLALHNCAVWMPNEARSEMILTHDLKQKNHSDAYTRSITISDPDVMEIKKSEGARILRLDSILGSASSGEELESGAVAAIRIPMLKGSDFKAGTPEVIQACYAILVLILPKDDRRAAWSEHELEIVEVVADQVAVALSHAAVLEESQLIRDKLTEQNRVLVQAREDAMMASEARNSFQKVMSQGMRRPIHSISGLLSMMQQENFNPEQKLIIDTMAKTSSVVSTLISDMMEIATINKDRFTLETRAFHLHSMIKEAASVTRCLCGQRGFGFGIQVENAMPDHVIGDENRIFHVMLHMVSNLLYGSNEGYVTLRIRNDNQVKDRQDHSRIRWKPNSSSGYCCVRFEIGIKRSQSYDSSSSFQLPKRPNVICFDTGLSFDMCKKLVQLMQGNIWTVPNPQGLIESMTFVLQLQLQPPTSGLVEPSEHLPPASILNSLRVLLADDDNVNRTVTQKLLVRLGCSVTPVASGIQCLNSLSTTVPPFELIVLDLHMPKMDGFEVAMKIRKLRSRSWPMIVALTASADEDVWRRCLQSGMNGLIRKPVLLQTLRDELLRVLHDTWN